MRTVYAICVLALLSASAITAGAVPTPCTGEVHHFVIEVSSPTGEPQSFKGAVGREGELQILEGVTPYRLDFSGSKVLAMFKADLGLPLKASLYVKVEGKDELVGSITDRAPAIYEAVSCREPLIRAFGRY